MKNFKSKVVACSIIVMVNISCKTDDASEIVIVPVPLENNTVENQSWTKVFEDQFSGNLSQWEKTNRFDYNSTICFYASSNPVIASIDDKSCLQLSASSTGGNYTSGHVKSTFSFQPSIGEEYHLYASVKLVAKDGTAFKGFSETYGAWPAFWTVNETNWPTKGEIDIFEGYSFGTSARYASNLFYGTTTGTNLLGTSAERGFENTEGWHTYHQYWKNENGNVAIEIFLDDAKVATYTNAINSNLQLQNFNAHNIIFNLNVGSNTNVGIFDNAQINLFTTTYMYVDWVKLDKRLI